MIKNLSELAREALLGADGVLGVKESIAKTGDTGLDVFVDGDLMDRDKVSTIEAVQIMREHMLTLPGMEDVSYYLNVVKVRADNPEFHLRRAMLALDCVLGVKVIQLDPVNDPSRLKCFIAFEGGEAEQNEVVFASLHIVAEVQSMYPGLRVQVAPRHYTLTQVTPKEVI
jgi:hypothetical protein